MLPREKFLLKGIDSLSDIELLQILVGSGIKGYSYKKISYLLLKQIQESNRVGEKISLRTFSSIKGVGDILAMKIIAGIELGRRVYGNFEKDSIRVVTSSEAYEIFKDMYKLKKERVDILCLNSRFEYILREVIAIGSLNCASVQPRDVLYPAISCNAAFVLMAHNHPSGDCTPSIEDVELTKKISFAMELVGIPLLDHIVVGSKGWSTVEI